MISEVEVNRFFLTAAFFTNAFLPQRQMRTIVQFPNGRIFKVCLRRSMADGVNTCDFCSAMSKEGCTALGFDCREIDALFDDCAYSSYLVELATPLISLNTPSEARREAAVL